MSHSATLLNISRPSDSHNCSAAAQVLTIGPWKQREFTAAIADIPAARDWRSVIDIDDACEFLSHCDRPPELLLFAQPFPGQVRQANIDHLQQLVPLARLVIVAGTWCEGRAAHRHATDWCHPLVLVRTFIVVEGGEPPSRRRPVPALVAPARPSSGWPLLARAPPASATPAKRGDLHRHRRPGSLRNFSGRPQRE